MARPSAVSLPGRLECPGTHWSDKEISAEERVEREDQIECKELGRRYAGEEERVVRADRESERRRTLVKEQEGR